jgi:peroxiredoxin Q/BCP
MAQLRRDFTKFNERETKILVIGPEEKTAFEDYWYENDLPFVGLPDPEHRVANLYGQEVKLLQMGRMPAQILVDKSGRIRYHHYGSSMMDIPDNHKLLSILDKLNQEVDHASRENLAYD